VFDSANRAKAVLQKMIAMYEAETSLAKPNAVSYTWVIRACAHIVGRDAEKADAMQIATATFDEHCRCAYSDPNHFTYEAYLNAISNLLPDGDEAKAALIASVFRKCCKDGQVSESVHWRIERSLTIQQLSDLYESVGVDGGKKSMNFSQVSAEWRRNVVGEKPKGNKRGPRR